MVNWPELHVLAGPHISVTKTHKILNHGRRYWSYAKHFASPLSSAVQQSHSLGPYVRTMLETAINSMLDDQPSLHTIVTDSAYIASESSASYSSSSALPSSINGALSPLPSETCLQAASVCWLRPSIPPYIPTTPSPLPAALARHS